MTPGFTVTRRQPGGYCAMVRAMFFWETLGPCIQVDIHLTGNTYLNIVADQVHLFMVVVLVVMDFFSRELHSDTLYTLLRNGLRNRINS